MITGIRRGIDGQCVAVIDRVRSILVRAAPGCGYYDYRILIDGEVGRNARTGGYGNGQRVGCA